MTKNMDKSITEYVVNYMNKNFISYKEIDTDQPLKKHMDSLDLLQMVMEIEEAYNIQISDEEAREWFCLNDVIKTIQSKVNKS